MNSVEQTKKSANCGVLYDGGAGKNGKYAFIDEVTNSVKVIMC